MWKADDQLLIERLAMPNSHMCSNSCFAARKRSGANRRALLCTGGPMIDDFQCLLLCGRELRIYNLDTGELVIKLREVMNQKMPFFGLNRPDHVVALSRSRMYVNMMNIAKGECVATFKVGEDRFLNSLTVSENGKTCVCGDDTQKVSALLVWDLSQRKLMYDLRIPHHEFLTRFVAITSEGHYVACVCREKEEHAVNFIVVYDLASGTLFKRWKPGASSLALTISTPGGSVVAALEDATVTANDLVTGNPRWLVKGHTYPADTIRVDPRGTFVLTYDSTGHDRAIRIWDMQTGASLSVWTPDSPVTACEVSADSRCVVVALAGRADLITLVIAHKTLPGLEDVKVDEKIYGNEENKGKEFELT
ncbi:uncharacterized protein LOC108681808 [Hyalella azteca]|uniref:Uncharacterized protein LOC108681808 n=1 Tax=Hyalella azteca TaxID=294128 RepID=A0A979FPK9_HYAAZ|nr:uncharacterized protein LOC108681808 [Hyalella azteca]